MPLNPNPSYGTGFARSKAESAFPEMWEGLIGAWAPFLGPTGELMDWSGKANHGILTNMDTTEWIGDTLNFPGDTEKVTTSQSVLSGLSNVSWGCQLKFDTFVTNRIIAYEGESGVGLQWQIFHNLGVFEIRLRIDTAGGFSVLDTVTAGFALGIWYTISWTFDGTNMLLYIDGVKNNTGVHGNPGAIASAGNPLVIGGRNAADTDTLDGLVRSVYAYNRTLSDNEVYQLHSNPKGPLTRKRRVTYFTQTIPIHNRARFAEGDRL